MPGRFRAYLPLVEPYASLRDLDPASAEGRLAERLDGLVRTEQDAARRRRLATLRVRLDYLSSTGWASWKLDDLAKQLAEVMAGRDPFAAERGNSLRGYYAANDDSCQPYSLTLPDGYSTGRHWPLVMELHCHGWGDWYRPFQGHPASQLAGAIVAAPHGRGSGDYLWIAEDDVLAVIEAVSAELPVDPARVYVTGWSMGGTGSFTLPARRPDRFAASFPKAGNADFTAWEEAWKEDRPRLETPRGAERMFLRWQTAPVSYAENFLHVPIAIDHGAGDSTNPVAHSKSMAGRLAQLGYADVRLRTGQGGHGWGASLEERFQWMLPFRRPERPERVRIKTADLRHGSAYWAEITRLADRMKMAELDVKVAAPDRVEVTKCENIERFGLDLGRFELAKNAVLAIDGQTLHLLVAWGEVFNVREVVVEKTDGRWSARLRATASRSDDSNPAFPPPKRAGLEGPIHDAFRDPFLVVIGTTAADEFERAVVREEAERWRRQWRRRFQCWPPCKEDREVTDADIAAKNLVLFGGPAANSITARVNAKLPARIEGNAVIVGEKHHEGGDLGLKLCHPNPLNPERLVVLQAATSWRGMWQMSHRFGNWFDWMPLDNRDWFDFCVFDDRSTGFETFLDVGFFDEDWQLARANRWGALPDWRERSAPRRYPQHRRAPAGAQELRLSDLWPRQIDTAKGPLQIDRSFNGQALRIGQHGQSHGLGQWIESAVCYDLDGRWRSLRLSVGIDGEGQTAISSARRATERPVFEVWGDGRLLALRRGVAFGDAPESVVADVTGVRSLALRVLRSSPEGWLYGPVTWGEPVLSVEPVPASSGR